jgi:pyroglutamyl-peptidase
VIIVAAFEPFGGRRVNRSWLAVERVRAPVTRVQLPVAFARLARIVPELAARASALLLVGEANRRALSIERVAKNRADARLADNDGAEPHAPLDDGPDTLAATWDPARALAAARGAGVPAELSDDAGAFCCNAALYRALRAAPATTRVGFLHVPSARWPLGPRADRVARAIEAIVETMSDTTVGA